MDAGIAREAVPTSARQLVEAATCTVAAAATTFAVAKTIIAAGRTSTAQAVALSPV